MAPGIAKTQDGHQLKTYKHYTHFEFSKTIFATSGECRHSRFTAVPGKVFSSTTKTKYKLIYIHAWFV